MIKWFSHSLISQLAFILSALILLWVRAFLHPVEMPEPCGFVPIYSLLYALLHKLPIIASLTGMVVMIITGYIFNELLYSNKLIPQGNWTPMFLMIVASCCMPQMLTLHPIHLANLMILGGVRQSMLHSSKLTLPSNNLASIMTFIVMAGMCCFPYLLLLLILIYLIPAYKSYTWTDLSAILLGISAPLIPVLIYFYVADRGIEIMQMVRESVGMLEPQWGPMRWIDAVLAVLFCLLLTAAVVYYIQHHGDRPINIRKNIAIINYFTILCTLLVVSGGLMPLNSGFLIYGFAFLTYNFLNHNSKSLFWNLIFSLWIVFTIVNDLLF